MRLVGGRSWRDGVQSVDQSGTSAYVAIGAAVAPIEQPKQAEAWGRCAGTGAGGPESSSRTAEAPIGPMGRSRFVRVFVSEKHKQAGQHVPGQGEDGGGHTEFPVRGSAGR